MRALRDTIFNALIAIGFSSIPGAFAQPIYTVTDLGTLGGKNSQANGVSNCGHVVGYSETGELQANGQPVFRGFVWHTDTMTDLGTLGGAYSVAFAVNCASQVVGWSSRPDGSESAYLWLAEPAFGFPSGINALPLSEARSSAAMDINENGQIAGRAGEAFVWLPDEAFGLPAGTHSLGHMSCYSESIGINNLGEVVGGLVVWLPQASYGLDAGFHLVWLPICISDWGYDSIDLNDHGFVLGFETTYFGPGLITTQLGADTAAASERAFARSAFGGLNNLDQVVDGVLLFDARRDGAHRTVDLRERTRPVTGWEVWYVTSINDFGHIAGVGRTRQRGESHAWLLAPIDADLDDDGLVMLLDFAALPACLAGPAADISAACVAHDLDRNGRVDMLDVQLFQWAFGSQP